MWKEKKIVYGVTLAKYLFLHSACFSNTILPSYYYFNVNDDDE